MKRGRNGRAAGLLLALVVAAGCSRKGPPSPPTAPASSKTKVLAELVPVAVQLCEHGVPADLCTRCNPSLGEVFKEQGDWCEKHGLPESHCKECNPALTFVAPAAPADWCKEHAVPESKCTKCHPRLVATFVAAGDFCREHGFPESVCPSCHPELAKAAGQPAGGADLPSVVRLASPETEREAGIETRRIETRRVARSLDVVGRLDYNQNRMAQLSARGEALVIEVRVDVGDPVRAGQSLLVLASAAVGEGQARLSAAEARLASARSALSREKSLVERNISPRRSLEEAEREHASAEADKASARAALDATGASATGTGGRYELRAPFSGTVVAKDAVAGKSAAPGQVLVQVADLSVLWAQLDVPEADAASVRSGQRVTLTFEGSAGGTREGTISRVATAVDPATRTVTARVEVPNPGGALKTGMFLRGRIEVTAGHDALLVPLDAVQKAEGRTVVFVRKGASSFKPVPVELGIESSGFVEVLRGLAPGAEVVTTGAFLLKTEILKDSIGAGCCDVEK